MIDGKDVSNSFDFSFNLAEDSFEYFVVLLVLAIGLEDGFGHKAGFKSFRRIGCSFVFSIKSLCLFESNGESETLRKKNYVYQII